MLKKIITAVVLSAVSIIALADFDPVKRPIEIVVAYPPGGNSDRVARIIEEMFTNHGWRATVLNKPGADTVIAANFVAKAVPDGHVLFMGGTGFLDSNIAFKTKSESIEYTEASFTPVVPMGISTMVLAVPANSPVNSYAELKEYVRRNPNKFNVAYWNRNTANLFTYWAKLEKLPVPQIINYKGGGPQVIDLIGGNVDFAFDVLSTMKPHWQSGKIKIIAALTPEGARLVHEANPAVTVPALSKLHPELDLNIWYGLYAPAGTDFVTVARINNVVTQALKNPVYADKLKTIGIINPGGSFEDLRAVQTKTYRLLKNTSKNVE
jgi:tripartite-type tricarboxylate transporter receptor subunit TctC